MKKTHRIFIVIAIVLLLLGYAVYVDQSKDQTPQLPPDTAEYQETEEGQAPSETINDQEAEEQLQKGISAFEITAKQRELAEDNIAGYTALDAGRGNPNWINTQSRYAFTRFMEFAVRECERDFSQGSMAGRAQPEGIGERFDAAMDPEDSTDAFLIDMVSYCTDKLGLDKDGLLKELADAVIGDYYPSPSRCHA